MNMPMPCSLWNVSGINFMEFEELCRKVDLAIENLPEEVKTVFKMSRFEDLKYREIQKSWLSAKRPWEARMTKALKS